VLLSTLLISLLAIGLLRLQIADDQLYLIRLQQLFGLFCLIYWYIALIISPLGYIIGKQRLRQLEFARRAIGVSAFYFALLHASISLWGQIGGVGQIQHLPALFQWSLIGGSIALGILGVMAATSFDRVISYMTYRKWKMLHRLVYISWFLVVLHVWSVGTHLAYTAIQLVGLLALALLSGLEIYRIATRLNNKLRLGKAELSGLFLTIWAAALILILTIPTVVQNYHSRHADHTKAGHNEARR